MVKYLYVSIISLLLSACGGSSNSTAPTRTASAPQTQAAMVADDFVVQSPIPQNIVTSYNLDTNYYKKVIMVWGNPLLSPSTVDDKTLKNAAEIVARQLGDQSLAPSYASQIRDKLFQQYFRVMVYSVNSKLGTQEIPEYKDFPAEDAYGATKALPFIGLSELNSDYTRLDNKQGNSLVHELMHAIHLLALVDLIPNYNQQLKSAYNNALAHDIWDPATYISSANEREYLAEGAELWFEWNTSYIDLSREQLAVKDPELYDILATTYQSDINMHQELSFVQPLIKVQATFSREKVLSTKGDSALSDNDYLYDLPSFVPSVVADNSPYQVSFLSYQGFSDDINRYIHSVDVNNDPNTVSFGLVDVRTSGNGYVHDSYQLLLHIHHTLMLDCTISKQQLIDLVDDDNIVNLDQSKQLCISDYQQVAF